MNWWARRQLSISATARLCRKQHATIVAGTPWAPNIPPSSVPLHVDVEITLSKRQYDATVELVGARINKQRLTSGANKPKQIYVVGGTLPKPEPIALWAENRRPVEAARGDKVELKFRASNRLRLITRHARITNSQV